MVLVPSEYLNPYRYITVPNLLLFRNTLSVIFRSRVFSRAFGWGARRRLASTPQRKCGFRPRPGARALGVQSRKMWQVIASRTSARG